MHQRQFQRWVKLGETAGDLMPVDDEKALLPAWHQRMRDRGLMKHRLPAEIIAACTGRASPAPSVSAAAAAPKPVTSEPPRHVDSSAESHDPGSLVPPEESGIVFELQQLEQDVAAARREVEEETDDDGERRRLEGIYHDKLKLLASLQRDLPKRLAESSEFMRVTDFEEEHAAIVGTMVQTLDSSLTAAQLHARLQSSLTLGEFVRVMRETLRLALRGLRESKFAPHFDLAA